MRFLIYYDNITYKLTQKTMLKLTKKIDQRGNLAKLLNYNEKITKKVILSISQFNREVKAIQQ